MVRKSKKKSEAIIVDMSDEEYFADPAVDQSQLKAFLKSPANWAYERKYGSKEPTPSMQFGTVFHAYMLGTAAIIEPDFEVKTRNSAKWRDWLEDLRLSRNDVYYPVTPSEACILERMKANFERYPEYVKRLEDSAVEQAIFWTDEKTGIQLKAKVDALPKTGDMFIDLKTAVSAQPRDFMRHAFDYGYHVQAEFYRTGIYYATGRMLRETQFWVFEKDQACDWAVYTINSDNPAAPLARQTIRQALQKLALAIERGENLGLGKGVDAAVEYELLNGYPKQSVEVDFAPWVLTAMEEQV